jgi:hypothetical protein
MKIENHNILLNSQHQFSEYYSQEEQWEVWQGKQRLKIQSHITDNKNIKEEQWILPDAVEISQTSLNQSLNQTALQSGKLNEHSILGNSVSGADDELIALPTELSMMRMILETFFGIKIKIFKANNDNETSKTEAKERAETAQINTHETQATQQNWGMRYDFHEIRYQKEAIQFNAQGTISTEDGREFQFHTHFEMSKEKIEEISMQFRAGDGLIDPLVLNFDGQGVQFTAEPFQFDLNTDGIQEKISFLKQGSGFLVLDKNNDGIVNDGSELFGPATNNGFMELKAFDQDQNDWIDENDPIFYQLQVWTKDPSGRDFLAPLQQYDIGAMYLNSSQTPLNLTEGQLRETGIYLTESGQVNLIQQVDLKITK